jgi:thiol:disulfide interchange protein DsbD
MRKICLFMLLFCTSVLAYSAPLPANEAFQLSIRALDPNTFTLDWHIKPGYFLYQKRIQLKANSDQFVHLGALRFPVAMQKTDKLGHTYDVYRDRLLIPVSVLSQEPGEYVVKVNFQGCSDDGFCYPPQTIQVKLSIDQTLALTNAEIEPTALPTEQSPKSPQIASDKLEQLFSDNTWPLIILSFFGFGLLLSFTPCILPMVPVLSGIIVGHGHDITTRKAFLLSLSYVLSMSLTYGVVGAMIALMGNNLQIMMQSPWAIGLFALIFVLLALSMFNFYELRLPVTWQSKLASITRGQTSGHYLSAAVMGCMSTLILSPCVTAPMIGALGYIAHNGNVVLGLFALFFLGLGMGTPLLFIGASAGKLLPKAGQWMNGVKSIFGVLLLAVAIDLLSRIIPSFITMFFWASLLICSSVYLGALQKANSNLEKFCQGIGILFLSYGLIILVGASQGNSNPLRPLKLQHAIYATSKKNQKNVFVAKSIAEIDNALTMAQGKPVMIDFYADWCKSCKIMEATTLKNAQIRATLKHFVVVIVDLTKNNAETRLLLNRFGVVAPPTFIFYNAEGQELPHLRLVGETSTETFFAKLKQV